MTNRVTYTAVPGPSGANAVRQHPRYHLHFTPNSASWVNRVECFIAEITQRRIRRGTFTHVGELERAIHDYIEDYNRPPNPFGWTTTADAVFDKVKRFCERTSEVAHERFFLTISCGLCGSTDRSATSRFNFVFSSRNCPNSRTSLNTATPTHASISAFLPAGDN